MPDAPGFDDMPLYDVPAAPASVGQAASRRRLRSRFLRAGPDAVDERELLELLLSGHGAIQDAGDRGRRSPGRLRHRPARRSRPGPDRLRTVPGLSEDAIAALKAAEALGIRMARANVPETLRPSLGSYDKVIEYCRALAGHREVEEFRILYLNRRNRSDCGRVPPERLRLPHAGLSTRSLHPRAGASGQRDRRPASAPGWLPRALQGRHRHDQAHEGRAEDHRGHSARPHRRHPDRRRSASSSAASSDGRQSVQPSPSFPPFAAPLLPGVAQGSGVL